MDRSTEVFLGDLEFRSKARVGQAAEEGMKRLAWHEIQGAVLDLNDNILTELSVERIEFTGGLFDPVLLVVRSVNEGPPDDDAAVGGESFRHQIGAVCLAAAVVLRTGLAFGVGLDQESTEVRNPGIDLIDLSPPPGADGRIEGIGRLESADLDRGAEPRGQVDPETEGSELIGQSGDLVEILRGQDKGVGIDIGQDGPVEADRGAGPRVVTVARAADPGQLEPFPEREAGVAALDKPVQVVPVIEDPALDARPARDGSVQGPTGLDTPEELEGAVEHTDILKGGDAEAFLRIGGQGEALRAEAFDLFGIDEYESGFDAEDPVESAGEFVAGGRKGG